MNRQRTPRPFVFYVISLAAIAAGLLALSWYRLPPPSSGFMLLLCAATIAAELLSVDLPSGGSTSLSYPLTMAAAVLLGPTAAACVAGFSSLNVADMRRRKPIVVFVFNLSQLVIAATVSAWVYVALGGTPLVVDGALTAATFPRLIVPLACLAASSTLMNGVLLSSGLALYTQTSARGVWRAQIAWMIPIQFALASFGFVIAQVLVVEPTAFVLFLFPLVVSRQMYQRYLGLRDAYRDTVRSLVAAIEAKDPYTRGHSERVAEYTVAMARQMGLSEQAVERLEFAALLHDLGKVGISGRILGKPAQLDDDEWREIMKHPSIGAGILARVPYLKDIVAAVRSHHERYDGRGYGDGLAAASVPLEARILAVADSYDAMTTERPYRPALTQEQAVEEIQAGRGTQFDPAAADAFIAWLAPDAFGSAYVPEPDLSVEPTVTEDV